MLGGSGLPISQQMGNCVSSQSQAGVAEKQAAANRGRNIVAFRKAAMEKYPVPTKCRLALNEPGSVHNGTNNGPALASNEIGGGNVAAQLRSKLKPPSVTIARPISIQLNKSGIDTNGNIPRPSSLPRLMKTDTNAMPANRTELNGQHHHQQIKPPSSLYHLTGGLATTKAIPFRTASLDSKNRTILNPPPPLSSVSSNNKTASSSTASKDSQTGGSISPSPSTMSVASSFGSNQSHSVADSGIATCSSSRSPTVCEKKSALSLKFGFYNKKTIIPSANDMKKAATDRFNAANISNASPSTGSQLGIKLRAPSANEQTRLPAKPRPTSLRLGSSVAAAIQRASSAKIQPSPTASKQMPTPQLTLIKNRAAQVLSRSRSTDYKSVELKPRMSVEAIVASLEQEIRHQLGPEPPPLSAPVTEQVKQLPTSSVAQNLEVERFGVDAAKAEIAFVDEDDEDFIEDIELQLQTPSSAAECHPSPEGDENLSRDEGHHGDEEDSNATSISDAMIDDEIADQPGLVMLGQSMSVPASPMHSWRSELFHYNLPPMSLVHYPPSEDDQSDHSSQYGRLVRRRVASVSDIDGGLKESVSGAVAAAATSTSSNSPVAPMLDARGTMRAELLSTLSKHRDCWSPSEEATIVIDLEEYTAMANELADIKSQLITLQNLLVETSGVAADGGSNCGVDGSLHPAPLWDLKRDLVLLREELQEKNTTIKTLKNELRAVGGRPVSQNKDWKASKNTTCNVATQTDRPRSAGLTNGLSPSESEEVQLVSTKLKLPTTSGLPVRSRPIRLTSK